MAVFTLFLYLCLGSGLFGSEPRPCESCTAAHHALPRVEKEQVQTPPREDDSRGTEGDLSAKVGQACDAELKPSSKGRVEPICRKEMMRKGRSDGRDLLSTEMYRPITGRRGVQTNEEVREETHRECVLQAMRQAIRVRRSSAAGMSSP